MGNSDHIGIGWRDLLLTPCLFPSLDWFPALIRQNQGWKHEGIVRAHSLRLRSCGTFRERRCGPHHENRDHQDRARLRAFGNVGAYERLLGRASGELNPADPANTIVQDLSLAPRNARGMVDYTTDFEVLKPVDIFADGFLPTLTVRAREQDPREPIPNSEWSFATCEAGKAPVPDERHVCYSAGFKPGRLYELIYRAKDPTVEGLGFAATRDLATFLRNSEKDDASTANPVYRPDNLAIAEGSSQSGRMIRSFIALGFNQDEMGRRVFDGAYPHIGGGLMPLNLRFGQPDRAWGEQTDHLYPAYDFPFTYAHQTDPLTQRSQGVLDSCLATDTCPRIYSVLIAFAGE